MEKYDYLFIDLYNLYHRNYFKLSHLTHEINGHKIITGGITGTLKSIKKLRKDFLKENGIIYYLSDNPVSKLYDRKEIDPTYKINRVKQSAEFYRSIQYLILILMNYSDTDFFVQKEGIEADDFTKALLLNVPVDKSVLLVSTDLDWARMILFHNRIIHWYNSKFVYDRIQFNKKYNFTPSEQSIINYKVFRGDAVDHIDVGLSNIPELVLLQLLDYEDIYSILDNIDLIPDIVISKEWKEKIKLNAPRLILNHKLVSFIDISDYEIKRYIKPCHFKPSYLELLYKSLGLTIQEIDSRLVSVFMDGKKSLFQKKEIDDFFKPL